MAGPVAEFFGGVRLLGQGLRLVLGRRRLFWLGVLPPLVTSVLFVIVLTLLATRLDDIAVAATPFAGSWDPNLAAAVRVLAGVGILGGSVLIMVVSFTTLTLALGSPIYDKISEHVDAEVDPDLEPAPERLVSATTRSVRQSLGLVITSALGAGVLFLVGLIPVVGQVVVPVVSACFGGWMVCLELIGSAFERRGVVRIADRRAAMRRRRARCWGLGIPTFLLLAIPFAGSLVFPIATAAGTLLARDLLPADVGRRAGGAAVSPSTEPGPGHRRGPMRPVRRQSGR